MRLVLLALFAVTTARASAEADTEDIWDLAEDTDFDMAPDVAAGSRLLTTAGSGSGNSPIDLKSIAIKSTLTGFTKATFDGKYQESFRQAMVVTLATVKEEQVSLGPITDVTRRRLLGRLLASTSKIAFDTIVKFADTSSGAAERAAVKTKADAIAANSSDLTAQFQIEQEKQGIADSAIVDSTITTEPPTDYTPPTPAPPTEPKGKKDFPVVAVIVPVVAVIGLVVMRQKNMACFSKGESLNNPTSQEGSAVAHQNAL